MAEEGKDGRLVERHPILDAVAQGRREQRGVVGEPAHDLRVGEAAAVLQRLRQVPMEQVDQWLDARVEQGVDEALVEVEAGLVDGAGPRGQHARPADAEAIGARPQVGHQPDVLRVAVVVVAGDVAGAAIGDRARLAGEGVPDRRSPAVLGRCSLDLVGGGGEAPGEVGRKGLGEPGRVGVERGRCAHRWIVSLSRRARRATMRQGQTDFPRGTPWRSPVRPARVPSVVQSPRFGDDWWQRGVIYQVYPRSFADSNGDGVGDLPGIIDHLDHLTRHGRSLGVDAIWLSPIYPSPGLDLGYDVGDHDAVDPLFGTDADFDRLVAEAHRRGIRVVLDLVMNHTSLAHRWFEDRARPDRAVRRLVSVARSGRNGDRFGARSAQQLGVVLRRPGVDVGRGRGQFYFHTFLPEQPDLNWRPRASRRRSSTMVRGWLERGVDGFRLDVFNVFSRTASCAPTRAAIGDGGRGIARSTSTTGTSPTSRLLGRFRAIVDRFPGGCPSASCSTGDPATAPRLARRSPPRVRLGADPAALGRPRVRATPARREAAFGADRWPTRAVEPRPVAPGVAARAWADAETSDEIARAAAVLLPDHARHAVPVLRRGARAARCRVPRSRASIHRPRGGRLGPGCPVVEPSTRRGADAMGGGSRRRVLDRPAVAAPGSRRRDPQRGRPGRRPAVGPVDLSHAHRAPRRHPALQVGTLSAAARDVGRRLRFERATAGPIDDRRGQLRSRETALRVRTRPPLDRPASTRTACHDRAARRRPSDAGSARGDHPRSPADVPGQALVPARIGSAPATMTADPPHERRGAPRAA